MNKKWSIQYGKGSAKGLLYTDRVTLSLGGDDDTRPKKNSSEQQQQQTLPAAWVDSQVLAGATSWAQDLIACGEPMDGIVGFAMKAAAQSGHDTLLENMYQEHVIGRKLFSVHLSSSSSSTSSSNDQSVFVLGDTDPAFYRGDLVWADVVKAKKTGMWYAEMKGVLVGHNASSVRGGDGDSNSEWIDECKQNKECLALVDTGTSYITMPQKKFEQLIDHFDDDLTRAGLAGACGFLGFQYVCQAKALSYLPVLWFQFGGRAFGLKPRQYMINDSCTTVGDNYCLAVSFMSGLGGHTYILGDSFIRSYYVVFDESKKRVGLGAMHPLPRARKRPGAGGSSDAVKVAIFVVCAVLAVCILAALCRRRQRQQQQQQQQVTGSGGSQIGLAQQQQQQAPGMRIYRLGSASELESSSVQQGHGHGYGQRPPSMAGAEVVPVAAQQLPRGAPLGVSASRDGDYAQL